MIRSAVLAALLAPALCAQFSGLAPSSDGGSLYFVSTLRLKGTPQPLNGKVFLDSQDAVQLFRARERANVPANTPPCTVGGFRDYVAVETSSAGVIALLSLADAAPRCTYAPNLLTTELVTASGSAEFRGVARLSASGPYAVLLREVLVVRLQPGRHFFRQSPERSAAARPSS